MKNLLLPPDGDQVIYSMLSAKIKGCLGFVTTPSCKGYQVVYDLPSELINIVSACA